MGIVLKRDEAISVLKELLDNCTGLDGHGLELITSNALTSGYQIVVKGVLDEETKQRIDVILTKHQLTSQMGNLWKTKHSLNKAEPDTLILFKPERTFVNTNTLPTSKT